MGEDEDRRLLTDIATRLARMEGAQAESKQSISERLTRIDTTISTNNRDAEASRRALHQQVLEFGSKLHLMENRVENMSNDLNLMAPMSVVTALNDSHRALDKEVESLRETRAQVHGAAVGMKSLGKGIWAVLVALGSFIGGTVVAAVEHFMASGGGSPR